MIDLEKEMKAIADKYDGEMTIERWKEEGALLRRETAEREAKLAGNYDRMTVDPARRAALQADAEAQVARRGHR